MDEKINLFQRMLAITNELGTVAKNLDIQQTKTSSYKAVSERDVIDAVKPLEAKYGVFSYPVRREVIESEILESEREYNGNKTKVISKYMRVATTYAFVNVDEPMERLEITSYGDGIDTGDKAPGKAMTYADKYALMKAYKISTGEDPDQEASPESGYKKVEKKATDKQIGLLKSLYQEHDKLLEFCGVSKFEELSMQMASDLIAKKKETA